jgi:serine protease Do
LLLAAFAAEGCQRAHPPYSQVVAGASSPAEATRRVSRSYTPFADQGDHLRELIESGQFDDAALLYTEQTTYFDRNRAKQAEALATVAAHFNEKHGAALRTAAERLAAVGSQPAPVRGPEAKEVLAAAKAALAAYPDYRLLRAHPFRAPEAAALERTITAFEDRTADAAAAEFQAFDHFGPQGFFEVYPATLDRAAFFAAQFEALTPRLRTARAAALKRFAANYPKDIMGEARWNAVGEMFAAATLAEGAGKAPPKLVDVLGALRSAKAEGFEPKTLGGVKFTFVEVTSKTLLKEGQIEFPATVDVDLPFEFVKAELDDAMANPALAGSAHAIVFDVALAKTKRRVVQVKKIPSTLIVGWRTEPNPNYPMAQQNVSNARMAWQQASFSRSLIDARPCNGVDCIGKTIEFIQASDQLRQARDFLESAMAQLSSTPMTIQRPVRREYAFDEAAIKAEKVMTVHYYVIDRVNKSYFKSTFDIIENKSFEVAYRVHAADPHKSSHEGRRSTERDVKEWEEAPSSIKLSRLVEHYLGNAARSQPLPGQQALRAEMLRDKNLALARFKDEKYDTRPSKDARFDSVVVVYATGRGGLGSGFFVKPDIVLTNWHVVEDATFVELKSYDGQETFGKVLARDARLDLALVKVQSRGRPVQFQTAKEIDLGRTVEAIGHPRRLEFTITRGIVSAIRRHPSINLPPGAGRDVLYVQTDAPINAGNSGGPLFLGDKVVGVNTWGLAKRENEGLNFAVHFSEVVNFLKEYLPSLGDSG